MNLLDSSSCGSGEPEIDPSDQVSPEGECILEYLHQLAHMYLPILRCLHLSLVQILPVIFLDRILGGSSSVTFVRWKCDRKMPSGDSQATAWA